MIWQSVYVRYAGLGMIAGGIGMAVLLAQPLFNPPGAAPIRITDGRGGWSETFRINKNDIVAQTGDRVFTGGRLPGSIASLPDSMQGSSVLTAQIRNASGEVIGVASRYTVAMKPGARPDSLWTLVLTRRGTIATLCSEAHPESCGTVIGGAGGFAKLKGRLSEKQGAGGYELVLTSAGAAA